MPNTRVRPGDPSVTHDLALSDGDHTWGITLNEGAKGIQEMPATPSNLRITGGGTKFGDYDPMMSHIEQGDWSGGRGQEYFSDDPTRYFDGKNVWSLTPGKLFAAPQWVFGEGYYWADVLTPGSNRYGTGSNVEWKALLSSGWIGRSFVATNNAYTATRAQLWVRKIGTPPSNLRIALHTSSGGNPGSSMEGYADLASSSVDGPESQFVTVTLSSGLVQSSGSTYWLTVHATSSGNMTNHWEVGYSPTSGAITASSAAEATDGATWAASSSFLYFRCTANEVPRKWHFFNADGGLYMVDQRDDGTAPTWYVNGDKGRATGGSANTIVDSGKSWPSNFWTNARVRILRGTGVGQNVAVTANNSSTLTTSSWTISPDATSEYVIYDTNEWTQLSSAGFSSAGTSPITDVAVANDVVYVSKGGSSAIGKMTWTGSTTAWAVDSTNVADYLHTFYDPVDGAQVWRALSSANYVQRASPNGISSALSFTPSSGIPIGDKGSKFTGLCDYNDQLYVFKEDSLWSVKNDRAAKLNVGLEAMSESVNGQAAIAQNLYLYFNWSHSLERLYGGTLDDIGPWKGAGMPSSRSGPISCLEPAIGWTIVGIDGGSTGISSVMIYDGRGYHEVFRGWAAGQRVRSIKWQACPGGHPRLWIGVGGEVVCLRMPMGTLNPLRDPDMKYQHEFSLTTSTIDMGARQLPKLFHELHVIADNLGSGKEIWVDYQLDDAIGSTSWQPIQWANFSPESVFKIERGDKKAIRLRLRGITNVATTPVVVNATVLEGVARTPVKRQWVVGTKASTYQVTRIGMPDAKPNEFYRWFQDAAITAKPLHMSSRWPWMHDVYVFAEAPSVNPEFITPDGAHGERYVLTIREI